MNKFKSIMMKQHGETKEKLQWLYVDRQVYFSSVGSSEQPVEEEKIYHYGSLAFRFVGTGFRTAERLILLVSVPVEEIGVPDIGTAAAAVEDFLLHGLSAQVNQLSQSFQNDRKDSREKPKFSMQTVTSVMVKRNGCVYDADRRAFVLRILFTVPLINGSRINGKSAVKGVRSLLECMQDWLDTFERTALEGQVQLYRNQTAIRKYLAEHGLAAFVADSSILPRRGGNETVASGEDMPLTDAVPFLSPDTLRVTIPLPDGSSRTGMGIPRGITVITGGGYSGKSTLLDSLEMGIYFHRKGDGREYVITDPSAVKIYAEDGRPVQKTDISPFFSYLPGGQDIHCFSTGRASGSVSQGTNIIEAVYGGSSLLLIDEDTSATNFMIRDAMMRKLVTDEPIVPFTDRICELKERGISTILVIGGSGEYLRYADTVLLMENYRISDRTEQVKEILPAAEEKTETTPYDYHWMDRRYLKPPATRDAFFYSTHVQIEHARYIRIDDRVADITRLTAMLGDGQITSLTFLIERLFMEEGKENEDLISRCRKQVASMFDVAADATPSDAKKYELWLDEVRAVDLFFAISRMRGVELE